MRGCLATQRNLRSIHLEYTGVSTRRALARGDNGAGKKSEFHKAAGIVRWKSDVFKDCRIAFAEMREATQLQLSSESGSGWDS